MSAAEQLQDENARLKFATTRAFKKSTRQPAMNNDPLTYHTRSEVEKYKKQLKRAHEALGKSLLGYEYVSTDQLFAEINMPLPYRRYEDSPSKKRVRTEKDSTSFIVVTGALKPLIAQHISACEALSLLTYMLCEASDDAYCTCMNLIVHKRIIFMKYVFRWGHVRTWQRCHCFLNGKTPPGTLYFYALVVCRSEYGVALTNRFSMLACIGATNGCVVILYISRSVDCT